MASTLAVCILLCLFAVAASQAEKQEDAGLQYKGHKYATNPPPHYSSEPPSYYPDGASTVTHKDFTFVLEEQRVDAPSNDTVPDGSNLVRTAMLVGHSEMVVGTVVWTGVAYTMGSKALTNWLVSFDITKDEWEGKVIAAGPGPRPSSPGAKEWAVVGGSGMFEGATGKVTWSSRGTYTFEITLRSHTNRDSYAAAQAQTVGLPERHVTS